MLKVLLPHPSFGIRSEDAAATGAKLEAVGLHITRYAIVLVLVWIGGMKFTAYEAGAIDPLVANSPLLSWLYAIFTSHLIGVACAIGSLVAIATFVVTLTFLFSTPGWEPSLRGPPRFRWLLASSS